MNHGSAVPATKQVVGRRGRHFFSTNVTNSVPLFFPSQASSRNMRCAASLTNLDRQY